MLVWDYLIDLSQLGKHSKVLLLWMPSNEGYRGNEKADRLTHDGSAALLIGSIRIIGPEPAFDIAKSFIKGCIGSWKSKNGGTTFRIWYKPGTCGPWK